jgi:hypothetical protein
MKFSEAPGVKRDPRGEVNNLELRKAGKGGCRTTDETTAEHPRLRNTRSVIYRQVSGRREPFADWMASMTIEPA